VTYKKKPSSQYSRKRSSTLKLKTKWGEVSYPKGTKPVVVEVKTDSYSSQIDGLGYRKDSDIEKLKKALEKKGKLELENHQKAEFAINFPKTSKKPVKFSVIGEQSITPPVIHHPAWSPPENLVEEIKEEMRKNPNRKTASDTEAMAYLNTASLAAPLSDQLCRIYFYLTRNYLKGKGWKKFDGSMSFLGQHRTLSEYDRRELNKLKNQIFKDQQKVLKERRKEAEKLRKEK
jgi:hypothetical protein